MVICECGGKLEITEENGKIIKVHCMDCGRIYERKLYDKHLFEIRRHNVWIHPLLSDLWRVFKRKGVNWAVKFAPKSDWWFQWWTPTWHFGKGPYLTIGLWKFRIYRGY